MPPPANGSDDLGPPAAAERGRTWILLAAAVVVVVALGSLTSRYFYGEGREVVREIPGTTMGTTYSVKVVVPATAPPNLISEIRDTVQARLSRVERLMSTWDSSSELSRFNSHGSTDPFPVSGRTLEVLLMARNVSEESGGTFDFTVGPLVDAWGFGSGGRADATVPPSREVLDSVRAAVGFEKVTIDRDRATLAKSDPGMAVDLSAIAKGYAVDRVADGLLSLGLSDFALEVGGEARAHGVRPDGSAWKAAIEAPEIGVRRALRVVELRNEAIATSGDYRNFLLVDGVRYAHIIDPRTGRPVLHQGTSVSVIHEDAAYADAWATALSVLGPEEGLAIAEREALAALFVYRTGEGLETRSTRAMAGRLRP
jgi:thiamine biosynthesis lipoprotein